MLVFAEADRVRIRGTVSGTPDGPLEVRGKIMHARQGEVLWSGPLGHVTSNAFTAVLEGLKPRLWSRVDPNLYFLNIEVFSGSGVLCTNQTRFGFRSMEIKDGQFHLNGRPVFLRGVAINPPGRTIPDAVGESRAFAEAYVRCLQTHNVNIFRISTDVSPVWFDVCDELGMMMYAGRYGSPPEAGEGKQSAPANFGQTIQAYQRLFENYVNHPSIVMYYLANELPVSGKRGEEFSRLLTQGHTTLREWDPTRPFIGNAGYGEGREGDVCDVHRYWGWYYNSFLTYYNLRDKLRPRPLFGDPAKHQPLTFTECVGSFTGSSGEFNVIRSKQLGPRLGWIGHTESPRKDALEYQNFMVREAAESFRRMRPLNPRLAGIMPFTILFYNWNGITNFNQMKPKPALAQMAVSYQPVLLSWENWTRQLYAGAKLEVVAHIINDRDEGTTLRQTDLWWELRNAAGQPVLQGRSALPDVEYFQTFRRRVRLDTPSTLAEGDYVLCGSVRQGNATLSTNWTRLFLANDLDRPQLPKLETKVTLYDPSGVTSRALRRIGGVHLPPADLHRGGLDSRAFPAMVIGEETWDAELAARVSECRRYVENGGRLLILRQEPDRFDPAWLPSRIVFLEGSPNDTDYPPKTRPHREQMCVNPLRPAHPVFSGMDRKRLRLWSDYTGWDQTKPGFPQVYPVTAGFRLLDPEDLARTAVLADYDRGLEGVALCEMFLGRGSIILCGLDLCRRAGLDPVADRLLRNLIHYVAAKSGHEPLPLVVEPITWGNFPSEQGVMSGSLNGFLVNTEWVPAAAGAPVKRPSANTGSWNMKPGDQFLPKGRNPFGPYAYSTGSSLRSVPMEQPGTGVFWARVPDARTRMITHARNPGKTAAELWVSIDAASAQTGTLTLPPGESRALTLALPVGSRTLRVRYTGPKDLVIEETRFE